MTLRLLSFGVGVMRRRPLGAKLTAITVIALAPTVAQMAGQFGLLPQLSAAQTGAALLAWVALIGYVMAASGRPPRVPWLR